MWLPKSSIMFSWLPGDNLNSWLHFFYTTILINGSVYSQCGDDTTLLDVRLPRLKSTADDSFNVTNGHVPITKASLQAEEYGLWFDLERDGFHLGVIAQDTLYINE